MSKARFQVIAEDDKWTSVAYRLIKRITKGRRYRKYEVRCMEFVHQGDFTQVVVDLGHPRIEYNYFTGIGFSKRAPRDPYSEVVGKTVALARAIRDALDIPLPKE